MNLNLSSLYSDLDRGDGICKYFDTDNKLCSIYETRPLKCNIDKSYELYFKDQLTRYEYYEINYRACEELKKKGR